MSSYTKSTDFSAKDSLLTGNPLKVVKGTELDDEFNSIQTAVNSKANLNSPDLTGSPTAPTANPGENTTQIASTAFVTAAINAIPDVVGGDGITVTGGTVSISTTSNGHGIRTVSTSAPSGGSDGDIWYQV